MSGVVRTTAGSRTDEAVVKEDSRRAKEADPTPCLTQSPKRAMHAIEAAADFQDMSLIEKKEQENKRSAIVLKRLSSEGKGDDGDDAVAAEDGDDPRLPTGIKPLESKSRQQSSKEIAHCFEEKTYGSPTYCDICEGLLVGLWSQGLQCTMCGMNVHRGQGVGDHDDCRVEALMQACEGREVKSKSSSLEKKGKKMKVSEVVEQLQQLAKSPNFLKQVTEQANRDIMAHATKAIVETGVQQERSKKFRRFKAAFVPFLRRIEDIERRGAVYSIAVLICIQMIIAGTAALISLVASVLSLWAKFGFLTPTSVGLAASHNVTVLATLHVQLGMLAVGLRFVAKVFKRKSNIVDTVLREMLGLEAEEDLGISVDDAAAHLKLWSVHALWSSAIMCSAVSLAWHLAQPPPPLEVEKPHPAAVLIVSSVAIFVGACCVALAAKRRGPCLEKEKQDSSPSSSLSREEGAGVPASSRPSAPLSQKEIAEESSYH